MKNKKSFYRLVKQFKNVQSRLPDINTSFNTYRTRAIMAIDSKKYTVCVGALYALNGLLPAEYRVEIDDDVFLEKTKTDKYVVCNNKKCNVETDYNLIKIHQVPVDPLVTLLTKKTKEWVWNCPKCNTQNAMEQTKVIQTVLKKPYFLKVVPEPPNRQNKNLDRKTFDRKFETWAWTLLDELEERMAQYRDDNWDRGGGELGEGGPNVDTTYEEEIP